MLELDPKNPNFSLEEVLNSKDVSFYTTGEFRVMVMNSNENNYYALPHLKNKYVLYFYNQENNKHIFLKPWHVKNKPLLFGSLDSVYSKAKLIGLPSFFIKVI